MSRALLVAFGLSVAVVAGCKDHDGAGWDWKRMRTQQRHAPYGANSFFADGRAMRLPPAGTRSRESGPPAAPLAYDSARASSRYLIFCGVCHGARADGVSPVASNMANPAPPSLLDAPARALSARQLYAVITDGFGRMPPLGAELSASDRWLVVEYLTRLQRRARGAAAVSAVGPAVEPGIARR